MIEIMFWLEFVFDIDVSAYAKPEFVPFKMYLIRQGLESGLSADESIKQADTSKVDISDADSEKFRLFNEIIQLIASTERG